ncbi:MAG: phage tail length tape measure family protein [Pirellulales bacterium]
MATIGSLVVNVMANTSSFSAGLKQAESALGGFASKVKSGVGGIAGALGGATGLGALLTAGGIVAGLKQSVEAAAESEKASRKLESVLKATGGAAGFSADELKNYAAQLQATTNFEDDATVSGMAVMATFKNISGDVFKDAIRSAQDLSSVMEQDLQSSIVQIGKALNDPIKGMEALQKVGVGFSEAQRGDIRSRMAAGDTKGAQGVILGELKSEFGGAAEALADPMTQLKNTLGDLSETIGAGLLPYVKVFASELQDAVASSGGLTEQAEQAASGWGVLADIVDVFGHGLQIAWGFAKGLVGTIQVLTGKLLEGLSYLGLATDEMAAKYQQSGYEWLKGAKDTIGSAWKGLNGTDLAPSEQMARAAEEAKRAKDHAAGLAAALGQAGDGADAVAKKLSGGTQFLAGLKKEIAQFGMGADDKKFADMTSEAHRLQKEGKLSVAKMWEATTMINQLQQLAAAEADAKAEADAFNATLAEAQRLTQDSMTPLEKYNQQIDHLLDLWESGYLDDMTMADQAAKAEASLGAGKEKSRDVPFAAAAERGSASAYSAIIKAQYGSSDPQKAVKDEVTKTNTILAWTNKILEEVRDKTNSPAVAELPA